MFFLGILYDFFIVFLFLCCYCFCFSTYILTRSIQCQCSNFSLSCLKFTIKIKILGLFRSFRIYLCWFISFGQLFFILFLYLLLLLMLLFLFV